MGPNTPIYGPNPQKFRPKNGIYGDWKEIDGKRVSKSYIFIY